MITADAGMVGIPVEADSISSVRYQYKYTNFMIALQGKICIEKE